MSNALAFSDEEIDEVCSRIKEADHCPTCGDALALLEHALVLLDEARGELA